MTNEDFETNPRGTMERLQSTRAALNEALKEWESWMLDADAGDFTESTHNDWVKYRKIALLLEPPDAL